MDVAIAKETEHLNSGLPFLATVGSTAPFVGLFGTVWGIKVAFEEIAISQNTSLAVVAPGIRITSYNVCYTKLLRNISAMFRAQRETLEACLSSTPLPAIRAGAAWRKTCQ